MKCDECKYSKMEDWSSSVYCTLMKWNFPPEFAKKDDECSLIDESAKELTKKGKKLLLTRSL